MNEVIILRANEYIIYSKKLRRIRNVLNLSQEDMANILEVNNRMVSYWEKGQRGFKIDTLEKFIYVLKINPYWLLWDEKQNSYDNIIGISSFLELVLKDYYIENKEFLFKSLRPNEKGDIEIFSDKKDFIEKLANYPDGVQNFKDATEILLADIIHLKPYVNEFIEKVTELEELLREQVVSKK